MPLPCPIVLHPPFVPPLQPLEEQLTSIALSLLLIPPTSDHPRPVAPCLVSLHKLLFYQSRASKRHFCLLCTAPEAATQMLRACGEWGLADASVNTMLICLSY